LTTADTEGRFFNTLSSLLNVPADQLNRESSRDSIQEWDSLKHMHLIMALEEEFGIEFDDREVSALSGAAALLDSIMGKLRE
jgi:acyl carrier protein